MSTSPKFITLTAAVAEGQKWRFPAASIFYREHQYDEASHIGAVVFIVGDREFQLYVTETPEQIDALLGVTADPLRDAAPDLLAALEGVLRVADRKTVEFDAARAAIAKARGEA